MADTPSEKEAVDTRFWQKFDELPIEEKKIMRLALQEVEKNLFTESKTLHQEVKQYKEDYGQLRQAA
jgi:TRAP-type C4-dicarboxylate transport system substrate-binding protein